MVPLNIFDQIAGLPLHPLVVHASVVLLPLAALALVANVLLPGLRPVYGLPTIVGLVAGAGSLLVSKESGEQLAGHVGLPARHADLAGALTWVALGLTAVAVVWWWLQRRERDADSASTLTKISGWVSVALVIPTLILLGLVGHSGAQAAWGDRINLPATTPSASSAPAPAEQSSSAPATSSSADASATDAPTASEPSYTLAEVAQHASPDSCWAAVDGKVYDLTDWIDQHPGGPQRIEQLCGTDASQAFRNQHGGNPEANAELASFEIGTLAE